LEEPNKAVVRIGGREYTMRGFVSEEYIHKVAIYVDKKMEEIRKTTTCLEYYDACSLDCN
jgi:cell division protein ZapA